jgi:Arc/MetJ-type ribon-helix-helix transcriptional regulator
MTIHLSKDLERIVHEAVAAGHYVREDDVIRDALTRLEKALPAASPAKNPKRVRAAAQTPKTPRTRAELNRRLMASGLVTSLPDPSQDLDDDDPDDQPVTIKGEPLSATVIRERR